MKANAMIKNVLILMPLANTEKGRAHLFIGRFLMFAARYFKLRPRTPVG
jgi:hypothetical protein